jgi:thiamine monophosphate kinase
MPLGEKALIRRVRGMAKPGRGGVAGIGDDAAILCIPPGHEALVTTDFTLEGVHFRREWHPPEVVGRRCLTRGLSDIAAMAGIARENVSRILNDWKRRKLVSRLSGYYCLENKAQLEHEAEL